MAAALLVAATALKAQGQIKQGEMTSQSLNLQADNLTQQAQEAEAKGQYDAMREQMIAGQRIGTAEAAFGASGVTANSGSVLDVMAASHKNAELDRMNILHGADVRAINYMNQAALNRFGGQNALQGGYLSALGSITSGATAMAGQGTAASPASASPENPEVNYAKESTDEMTASQLDARNVS